MDSLNELLQQRKALDERIKAIKGKGIVITDGAKIDKEHYPTDLPDRWYVAVKVIDKRNRRSASYRTVANAESQDEAIEKIPAIIKSLQELYTKAKEAKAQEEG